MFNFGVLLFVLWYFLYTPILKILNERHEKVKRGVADAEAAEETLKKAEASQNEIVAEAHHHSADIVEKAKKRAEEEKEDILKEAEERAGTIVANAEKLGIERADKIMTDAEKEIAQTAILAAEKMIIEKGRS